MASMANGFFALVRGANDRNGIRMPVAEGQRILVTGGAGFIGSALVWRLNTLGYENILVADRLATTGKWSNLVALKYADYIDADVLREEWQQGSDRLADVGLVLHMGACSATTEQDSGYLMRNNYEYTRDLCLWALKRGARFVYASSAATYGDGAQGMSDRLEDLSCLRPLNMYGYSKHLFDCWAKREGLLDQIVGLKFFNVFGPNENHKGDMRSVVNKAFDQIKAEGKVKLFKSHHPDYEDGRQMRDFLYVKDCVDMALFLVGEKDAGGLYNLGSGKARPWVDLVGAIFAAMDKPPRIEFVEMPEALRDRYQYFTEADIGRLREAGYGAELHPLEEAVRDYVTSYLAPGHLLGWEG